MLLNKTFALIIAFSLLFPSRIFPANTLAPAGVLETGLDKKLVQKPGDEYFEEDIANLIASLKHSSPLIRREAAESSKDYASTEIVDALREALIRENYENKETRKAEAEALLNQGENLSDINPEYAIKAVSGALESNIKEICKKGGIFLNDFAEELYSDEKWEKKLGKEKINLAYEASFIALKVDNIYINSFTGVNLFYIGLLMKERIRDHVKAQKAFIEALNFVSPDLKEQAVDYLGEIPNPQKDTIEKLIDALDDGDIYENAEQALKSVGNEDNVEIIIDALEKIEEKHIRKRLARILFHIGSNKISRDKTDNIPKIEKTFILALKYGDNVTRVNTVKEIREIKFEISHDIYDVVIAALKDKNKNVRIEAVKTLDKYHNDDCKIALINVLVLNNRSLGIGVYVARALEKYEDEDSMIALAIAVKNRFLPRNVRVAAAHVLGNKRKGLNYIAVEALAKGVESRFAVVAEASAMAFQGNKEIVDKEDNIAALKTLRLETLIFTFYKRKGKKYKGLRKQIAITLGELKHKGAVAILSYGLLYDKEPLVRRFCALSLGKIGHAKANEVLIVGLEDKNPIVSKACAEALRMIGSYDDKVVSALFSASEREAVRKSVEKALDDIMLNALEAKDLGKASLIKSHLEKISFVEASRSF